MHIYYLSVSLNILNLWQQLLVHGQQKVCESLCQFAPVITSLRQFATVCDSRRVANCLWLSHCQPWYDLLDFTSGRVKIRTWSLYQTWMSFISVSNCLKIATQWQNGLPNKTGTKLRICKCLLGLHLHVTDGEAIFKYAYNCIIISKLNPGCSANRLNQTQWTSENWIAAYKWPCHFSWQG